MGLTKLQKACYIVMRLLRHKQSYVHLGYTDRMKHQKRAYRLKAKLADILGYKSIPELQAAVENCQLQDSNNLGMLNWDAAKISHIDEDWWLEKMKEDWELVMTMLIEDVYIPEGRRQHVNNR